MFSLCTAYKAQLKQNEMLVSCIAQWQFDVNITQLAVAADF